MKLVIFDLDGVLVDSKDLHYQALNMAIAEVNPGWVISYQEHLQRYNGNPTSVKLDLLAKEYPSLNDEDRNVISTKKQEFTKELLKQIPADQELVEVMTYIRRAGVDIAVASNSIRSTVETILKSLGVYPLVGFIASNEDVENPKPNPEIYQKCMNYFGVTPEDTIILEDSEIGRAGALATNSRLVPINSRRDITLDMIKQEIENNTKLNILIPMAGAGSRFADAGYDLPKPLIDVNGKPMIKAVIDSLDLHGPEVRYTFIVQKSHYDKYDLLTKLSSMVRSPNIIVLDGMTEGAAATALLAKHIIDSDVPLIIANSDQVIDWDSIVFKSVLRRNNPIALFTDEQKNPKWSFAKIENGMVTEVAEKNPISEYASVGIYGWSKGSDYVKYAEQMIEKDVRVNNEFYICPVYNEAIQDGLKVIPYFVDSMHGLGTPEDLEEYLRSNND